MANHSDITRIRLSAQQTLIGLDRFRRRQRECTDAELGATLADINQRKSGQSLRLLDSLRELEEAEYGRTRQDGRDSLDDRDHRDDRDDSKETATDSPDPPPPSADALEVTALKEVTPDLLVFRIPRPSGFRFRPGQSVKVGLGDIRRSYSIVSAPHEPFLEFFVELAPGGQMSERLRRLKVGDRLSLGPPKGGLQLDESRGHHLMVATVTGINPFVSIVRDHLHRGAGGHRFHLLHGASHHNEHGYREELEQLAASHPDMLTYLPTVSRPQEAINRTWTGSTGRVDELVTDYLTENGLTADDTQVYACGHSGMLDAVAGHVRPLGFQLKTESYD